MAGVQKTQDLIKQTIDKACSEIDWNMIDRRVVELEPLLNKELEAGLKEFGNPEDEEG